MEQALDDMLDGLVTGMNNMGMNAGKRKSRRVKRRKGRKSRKSRKSRKHQSCLKILL